MKGRRGECLIIFGPLDWWVAFKFCVRLRMSRIEYTLCRNPRAVAVRERDIHGAAAIFDAFGQPNEKVTRGVKKSDQGAE